MGFAQQERVALGSQTILTVNGDDQTVAEELLTRLWAVIDEFEQRFSRFLPDSELNALNRQAGKTVTVSQAMYDILLTALALAEKTGGLFNPFILPALNKSGYIQSFHPRDDLQAIDYSLREVAGHASLELLADNRVTIPANSALDLGGIGKGYLLDQLNQHLSPNLLGYWLSLGGDILVKGVDNHNLAWEVAIDDAFKPGQDAAYVTSPLKQSLAIATSSVTKRQGVKQGKSWHHIIDPRTGQPATSDIISATICHPSAMTADVLASCLIIRGSADAEAWLNKLGVSDAFIQKDTTNMVFGEHIFRTA